MGIVSKSINDSRTYEKILSLFGKRTTHDLKKNLWVSAGIPTCTQLNVTALPVRTGDMVYDTTNESVWICTTAVAAAVDAVFKSASGVQTAA